MNPNTTDASVIRHVEALAAAAADEVVVPTFDQPGGGARPPRRRGMFAAAAVVVVAAAVGAGWWFVGDDEVIDTVDTAEPSPVQGERLVPTEWPTGVTGDVVVGDSSSPLRVFVGEHHHVLSHRGVAAAIVSSIDIPLGQPVRAFEEFQLGERDAVWSDSEPGGSRLSVAIAPGRVLSIASRVSTRGELEALAPPLAAADGDPSAAELPQGWTVASDPAGIAHLMGDGHVGEGWSIVSRPQVALSPDPALSVATRTVDDTDAVLELVAQLAGSDGTTVDVDTANDGVLVQFPLDDPAGTAEIVVWAPAPTVVAVAAASNIDRDEFLASVRSARPVSAPEWGALKNAEGPSQTDSVAGFDIPTDSTVIATGEDFGVEWLLSQEPLDMRLGMPGEEIVVTWLLIRDEHGFQGGRGGGGGGGGRAGVLYARYESYVVLSAEVPVGTTDVTIEVLGERHPTVQVPLPDGRTDFVFTLLPGRDTPDVGGTGVVHATLPDGTQLTSPPD